ncbi:SDR family oxidoreductase [Granulicella sp. S190]|uniref:SDR family NAD(P)-dependent oxidoreductase n=1 Tax=Granulicella sp. S190 TaxID=1747226 RepID=UPI00131C8E47|nr:SDR family oxidoreductase [Granulicella sp. S190]
MKTSRAALHATQILTGIAAIAAAKALMPRQEKRRLRGRVVLITGGSRGLGLALAHRFGRSGAKLILVSRNSDELTQARETLLTQNSVQHPDDILLLPADLTDEAQATTLVDYAVGYFGHIDILINNAGIIEVGPVEDQPISAYHRAMATNFFAALYTTRAALPHLLHRSPIYDGASIVNIASIGGKFAMPHMLPYVASKFALVGFSQGLHAELRHKGIRVTTVCPGLMRTGGEVHAHYTGQIKKEERWFTLAAKTPLIASSVTHAANKIYNAVTAGRAEITITPQAWLAARVVGLAPETTQLLASLVNEFILPAPAAEQLSPGFISEVSAQMQQG